MRVDGRPTSAAYLRFRVPGPARQVVRHAWLRLYVRSGSRSGLGVRPVPWTTWSERRLSWSERPRSGRLAAVSRAPEAGRWVTIEVTSLVRRTGSVAFALTTKSARGSFIAAHENRRFAPRLVLERYPEAQPPSPIRAPFYSPSFPEGFAGAVQHPALGAYDSGAAGTIAAHLSALAWGRIEAGLAWWDGFGRAADLRFRRLLAATTAAGSPTRWAIHSRQESERDPAAETIAATLDRLERTYGRDPAYLRVRGRPVVFVATGDEDGCDVPERWKEGNAAARAYLVIRAVHGFASCPDQPDAWYADPPAARSVAFTPQSVTISPGSFRAGERAPRLVRDLARWRRDVGALGASAARWQLVSSFNGWGDGSAVEVATEWASPSGYGQYLDALHDNLGSASGPAVAIAAAGDIVCDPVTRSPSAQCQDRETSDLIDRRRHVAVLALGDLQYEDATLAKFQAAFAPTWGRFKDIMHPALGNHEYQVPGAQGYFDYFNGPGQATGPAGARGAGYYSFDVGTWHVVALNSNCGQLAGGCAAGSPQESWLRRDLAAHPSACVLAFWHHPLFTSGGQGGYPQERPLWDALYRRGAEIVLNGDDHDYERFRLQDPEGGADPSGGLREFVVGTGGKELLRPRGPAPGLQRFSSSTAGVLDLTLRPLGYDWRFLPVPGGTFTDSGSGTCH